MKRSNRSAALFLAALLVLLFPPALSAADPFAPLSEDDVTPENLRGYFESAFLKTGIDKDGDLRIEEGGIRTYVRIDREKKLITFFSAWRMRTDAPELDKLKLVNALNDRLIFVRFSMPDPATLWCDYQFLYDGGITPYAIVNNYRLFAEVTRGAVLLNDPENIIEAE